MEHVGFQLLNNTAFPCPWQPDLSIITGTILQIGGILALRRYPANTLNFRARTLNRSRNWSFLKTFTMLTIIFRMIKALSDGKADKAIVVIDSELKEKWWEKEPNWKRKNITRWNEKVISLLETEVEKIAAALRRSAEIQLSEIFGSHFPLTNWLSTISRGILADKEHGWSQNYHSLTFRNEIFSAWCYEIIWKISEPCVNNLWSSQKVNNLEKFIYCAQDRFITSIPNGKINLQFLRVKLDINANQRKLDFNFYNSNPICVVILEAVSIQCSTLRVWVFGCTYKMLGGML